MIQDIIVYIIVGAVIAEIIRRIVKLFRRKNNDPCMGCAGCEIRETFRRKQQQCREKKKLDHPSKYGQHGGCSCGCH